jgi:hypothetical protein
LLTTFVDGANCLFAGHSFFVPIATRFDGLATDNGFSAHEAAYVFSSGATGAPELLWNDANDKDEIEGVLDDGDVELFALTAAIGPDGQSVGSEFDDYARWFDLALSYNPDTQFLIGMPWVIGGPTPLFPSAADFAAANETAAAAQRETVEALRAAYPDATIHYIEYGPVASIMYDMYEKDELPDIVGLTPDPANGVPPSDALFADGVIGHGGPMMTELAALTWMELLYGADIATLDYTDYESDVDSIVEEVLIHNQQFQPDSGVEPSAEILSAYLGAVDVRFPRALENVSGAPQSVGDDGMPLVMSVQVDASTLSPEDFAITTASGTVTTPTAVTLAPADEPDELRTILLTGPLGSQADLPVNVEIVGSVLSLDGEELKGLTADLEEEPDRPLPDGLRGRLGVGFNHFHNPMQQRGNVITNTRSASFRHLFTALNETREQRTGPAPRLLESDGLPGRQGAMATVVTRTTRLVAAHVDAVMQSDTHHGPRSVLDVVQHLARRKC